MKFQFNPKKSAQAAAVLLKRSGGCMDKYIFIKMLYLADREALGKWEEPITGDDTASMQFGPVLSAIYDLTKGDLPALRAEWEEYISDAEPEANRIVLKSDPGDWELCEAEIRILESIHNKFKNYDFGKMCNYCRHLQEHEDVEKGRSKPLPTERILSALGKDAIAIKEAKARHREIELADMLLGR